MSLRVHKDKTRDAPSGAKQAYVQNPPIIVDSC